MKQFVTWSLCSSLFISTNSFALNPVQGFYFGILGNINHSLSSQEYVITAPSLFSTTTDLAIKEHFSPVGGGGGAMLGYKLSHFRLEAEVLFNRLSGAPLEINGCRLESPNVSTPTGDCTVPSSLAFFVNNKIGFSGSVSSLYGLVNGYYDFFSYDGETLVVPYIGLGIGQVHLKNEVNFIRSTLGTTSVTNANGTNSTNFSGTSVGRSFTETVPAGQVILGVSYYIDDYAWVGMDYRYLSTHNVTEHADAAAPDFNNNRFGVHTLNFSISCAFDKGAIEW